MSAGDLALARAHWLTRDLIAWAEPAPGARVSLHAAPEGRMEVGLHGVRHPAETVTLESVRDGLPGRLRARWPHLAGLSAWTVPAGVDVPRLLRGQLAVSAADAGGRVRAATGMQLAGVLDALFPCALPLGPAVDAHAVTLRVWAPTARAVALLLYRDGHSATVPRRHALTFEPASGSWSVVGPRAWRGRFYLFEVEVFVPGTGRIEHNRVTDPYSLSLSTSSRRSQIVDTSERAHRPAGWPVPPPPLGAPEDAVLYELHVRDFSAGDDTVPPGLRGTYGALALPDTAGGRHLQDLAAAGVTHVQLLPIFAFASVDDDRGTWTSPPDLRGHAPDSEAPQAAVMAAAPRDGFNWGYDPWHWLVPEGSYAVEPEGASRIREVREMVAALHRGGLRVVMDVVFNHTYGAGQDETSVLDRIVPGYYHRRDGDGHVITSTCCPNTATEHAMMARLVVDAVRHWATAYGIDGFRFDIMGHHPRSALLGVRAALDALTPERDGIDGRSILLVGEGWDFAEVAGNARFVTASQANLTGTGIGTFNDRLRDAVRGGGPFGHPAERGFVTGLAEDAERDPGARERLADHADRIRTGLAGGLAAIRFGDRRGLPRRGEEVEWHRGPAGYTADPQESVVYVECHDNETLFDAIQMKAAPEAGLDERVRMHLLATGFVLLAQGIPFLHAGQELLRSKSGDRNSYDSGDWFNRLDWTGRTHGWGSGLPPRRDNHERWDLLRSRLADPALRPTPAHVALARAVVLELLRIRRSSRLFRLRTEGEVLSALRFPDAGPNQMPGVIAMELSDPRGRIDPEVAAVVVGWNARAQGVAVTIPELEGATLVLHPVQAASADPRTREAAFDPEEGVLRLPGRTVAVFWRRRAPVRGGDPEGGAS